MKKIFKIIVSLFLFISLFSGWGSATSANEVVQGFYQNQKLVMTLQDFQKSKKSEKKKHLVKLQKSYLLLGGYVYDFEKLLTLDISEDPLKFGWTLEDFEKKFGPLEINNEDLDLSSPIIYPSQTVNINYTDKSFRLVLPLKINTKDLNQYDEQKGISSIKLYSSENQTNWNFVGSLFDSGNLANHSDELKGDGYYSIGLNNKIDTSSPKTTTLKVEVTLANGKKLSSTTTLSILETVQATDVENAYYTFTEIENNIIDQFSSTTATVATVETAVIENLEDQEDIQNVKKVDGMLEVEYNSGLKSYINIVEEDESTGIRSVNSLETVENEKDNLQENIIKKRLEAMNTNSPSKLIEGDLPVITTTEPATLFKASSFSESKGNTQLTNRNVFLWAPFASEFSPWNEEGELAKIFNNSSQGYNVNTFKDTNATIDTLKNITNYGFVLFSTHGSSGKWLLTGEPIAYNKYLVEQATNQIAMTQHYIVTTSGGVKIKEPVYAVNHNWFNNNLAGTFDNTVIINSSCQSTLTPTLWNVFNSYGAGAYYGFDGNVTSKFAYEKSVEIVNHLVNDGVTTGAALSGNLIDNYGKKGVKLQLLGSNNIVYSNSDNIASLLNGDFELITAGSSMPSHWNVNGDGRVISGLGGIIKPTQGQNMGLISTGLGFTESLGEISQTFYLPQNSSTLSFDWNYISDEFLGFIGSHFDDPFTVSLSSGNLNEEVLFLSVNTLAEKYKATQNHGGSLTQVSPTIEFDQDDVWMTGWESHNYKIPDKFKGKVVTLKFSATDAQDTVFDTAVLIDNINVK